MKAEVFNLNEYRKSKKYDQIFRYALSNWNRMVTNATVYFGKNYNDVTSIADQIQMGTNCPYAVAEEVAQSICISFATDVR